MSAIEHFYKVLSYIPLADKRDLSILSAIITEFEEILRDDTVPGAILIQVKRCCKLTEHIILNEIEFDTGIHKLSQNTDRLIASLEKNISTNGKNISISGTTTVTQSNSSSDEMAQYREKFATNQKSVLDDFEGHILSFEKGENSSVQALKRILHTWKGEFGVLELPQFSSIIHKIEEAIETKTISADQLFIFKDFLNSQLSLIGANTIPEIPESLYTKLFSNTKEVTSDNTTVKIAPADKKCEDPVTAHVPNISDIDKSLLSDFIIESRDHIHSAEALLLTLESDPTNIDNLNSIFRSCHTIKGVASFINLLDLSTLSHSMESVMDKCRKGDLKLTSAHIDLLLRAMDCLKELIIVLENCMNGVPYTLPQSYMEVMANLKKTVSKNNIGTDLSADTLISITDKNKSTELPTATTPKECNESSGTTANTTSVPANNERTTASGPIKGTNAIEDTIRVPVQRLDQLIDAIGEAVIAQSMITADPVICQSTSQNLLTKISQTNMIMRQIQELSMSLRMISLRATFQKMARLVRDLSKKSEKEIHFITDGEETELDKSVVENIGDPLIHMIRNSVDHGIEPAEERVAKGKQPFGTISLNAYHKAGSVYIEIKDDGKGLDKELIFNKAVSKGLCKAEDKLSELEIYQFIFLPGFSTAKVVTDISGRGVGMDVVKRNIESLRGSVDIQSEKDIGTTFIIRLPLTLAIIDGMIVRVDHGTYIVPTLSIVETLAVKPEHLSSIFGKGEMIKVRNNLIPLIHLSETLNNNKQKINGTTKVALIVEDMIGKKTAFIVDEIIGQQQVVIKSLGNGMGDIAGVSGGAIMSDGTVSLILDVSGISKSIYA